MLQPKHRKCAELRYNFKADRIKQKSTRQIIRASMLLPQPKHKLNKQERKNQETTQSALQQRFRNRSLMIHSSKSNIIFSPHMDPKECGLESYECSAHPMSERQILKMNNLNYRCQILKVIRKIKSRTCQEKQAEMPNSNINNKGFKFSTYCRSNLLQVQEPHRFKKWESIPCCQEKRRVQAEKLKRIRLSSEIPTDSSLGKEGCGEDVLKGWQQPRRLLTLYQQQY